MSDCNIFYLRFFFSFLVATQRRHTAHYTSGKTLSFNIKKNTLWYQHNFSEMKILDVWCELVSCSFLKMLFNPLKKRKRNVVITWLSEHAWFHSDKILNSLHWFQLSTLLHQVMKQSLLPCLTSDACQFALSSFPIYPLLGFNSD